MGGLEKIIGDILSQAQQEADKISAEADEKISQLTQEYENNKEKLSQDKTKEIQEACMRASASIEAGAESDAREIILNVKNEEIENTIEYTKDYIKNLPVDEYFDLLSVLIENNRENSNGVIYFSKKDLERLTDSFKKSINDSKIGKLVISDEVCDIDGGFIISYGKIDINCSIDSIFEEKKNRLFDIINENLK